MMKLDVSPTLSLVSADMLFDPESDAKVYSAPRSLHYIDENKRFLVGLSSPDDLSYVLRPLTSPLAKGGYMVTIVKEGFPLVGASCFAELLSLSLSQCVWVCLLEVCRCVEVCPNASQWGIGG
jgi:hypothetical protein